MQTFFLFDIPPEIYALQTIFMFGLQNSETVLGRSIMLGLGDGESEIFPLFITNKITEESAMQRCKKI